MKPDMELALPARAENIAIVRHALGGLGEVFGIPEEKLSDIRLAVTEACSNVVVHAYPERGGTASPGAHLDPSGSPGAAPATRRAGWGMMEISATMVGDELLVVVRDWGAGIRPRPDSPGLGLGLSLIAALAETVQLGHDTAEHTEVRMTFALSADEPDAYQEQNVATAAVASIRPDGLRAVSDGQT
jgi:serine/threonine-protein kinase RsbW